ncbi:ABC transporter ATP-binding protein [Gloeothece citriformis]|nr:ABC transporter ATP-binding protein [Gloeothece citriformis]
MFFYVIKHSPEWFRPIIIANIIDIISHPKTYPYWHLWLNGIILVVATGQNIVTHYWHIRYMSLVTRKMESNLRATLAQQLQQLSISFYYRNSSGVLQAKILRDVEAIQLLTNQIFQFLPSTILTILIAIIVTAIRAPIFLIFFLATIPIAVLLIRFLKEPLQERNRVLRQQIEELSAHLIEMLKLIPVTRAHGAEAKELERTTRKLLRVEEAAMRVDSINAVTNASSWVTLRLFSCLCLLTSAILAYQGQWGVTVGSVVLLTTYFDTLTTSVVQILTVLPQISKGFDAVRSIGEILECTELEPNQGKKALKKIKGAFIFDSVSFTYPGAIQPSLIDFSLTVQPGETVAIVGPSGAGKSTLLNLIIGFLRPTQGKIFLDGQDLNSLDLRTYRRFLAVVSQETILFGGTVKENLIYGLDEVTNYQLQKVLQDANALEFIEELPEGINTLIGENGIKLSGGQRQRIAIARALLRNPQVLILDEATASLDSAAEHQIQQALERLMAQRTTFVVAHRLSTIRKANRIIVMEKGKIKEIGNYSQLLSNRGLFSQLHALQTL